MILRLFIFYFLLFLPFINAAGYGNCPYRCECHPHHSIPSGWKAECTWDNLPDDSPFAVSSSILSLSITCSPSSKGRSLSSITLKGLHQLHQLKIHKCGISSIEKETFKKLEELRELILTEISTESEQFELLEESLLPLSRLNTFQLSDSKLGKLPSSLLCTLSNLQMLNVSGNNLSFSSFLSNCKGDHLIIVDISRNRFGEILSSTFDSFPVVRQLVLAYNSISSMHSLSFNNTRLLQQLDIEGNSLNSIGVLPDTIVSINGAYNSFSILPPSIGILPNLVFLNMSHNGLSSSMDSFQSTHLESVDLSFNSLNEIPSIWNRSQSSLNHLDLSHNKISSLKKEDFNLLGGIQTLNLGSNSLAELGEDSLIGLSSLMSLDLSHNRISIISPSSLIGLNLDNLLLNHNKLDQIPLALSHLSRCKSIDISSNSISSISNNIFSKIPQLTTLDLSDNRLEKISQFELSDSSQLSSLSLSHNSIREIGSQSLIGCLSLRRLDLSFNRLSSIFISPSSLNALRYLNISSNLLMELDWKGIPSKVENVNLDRNRMRIIKGNPVNHRIRTMSISHNVLSSLLSSHLPDTIESIDLSFNSISSIGSSTFASKSALTFLNLGWNSLRSLPFDSINVAEALSTVSIHINGNPLECSCEMDWMKKGKSSINHLNVVDLSESECIHLVDRRKYNLSVVDPSQMLCNYTRMCANGCNCCAFSSCDCKSECPRGCECWTDATKNTNVVKCHGLRGSDAEKFSIREIPMHATHIHLSDFSIPLLKQHSFFGRTKLAHLHMNKTSLRLIEPMAFNKASNLQLLDLSSNNLREFRSDALFKTTNITHLFLDHNKLERIDDDLIKKLPHLKALTLHENGMEDIPLSLSSILSLTLSNNPFRCDCDTERFNTPSFLLAHRDKIVDSSRMHCVENVTRSFRENDTTILSPYPPNYGYDIYNISMNDFLREMNISICIGPTEGIWGRKQDDIPLIIILALFFILLILLAVCLIVNAIRRNRCGMRQKRYKLNSSMNCSTTPGASPLPAPLLGSFHDVFISYSHKDEKLVREKIVNVLENDHSLCLLHVHGPKYDTMRHAVSDELTQLMKSCSTIIVVITKNFLEEEWMSTQIKISHQLVAKENKNQFLAVVGDDVDMNRLDEALGSILRKKERIRISDHLYHNTLLNYLPTPTRYSPSDNTSEMYYEMGGGIVPSAIV